MHQRTHGPSAMRSVAACLAGWAFAICHLSFAPSDTASSPPPAQPPGPKRIIPRIAETVKVARQTFAETGKATDSVSNRKRRKEKNPIRLFGTLSSLPVTY